jgi:hypothetical protein
MHVWLQQRVVEYYCMHAQVAQAGSLRNIKAPRKQYCVVKGLAKNMSNCLLTEYGIMVTIMVTPDTGCCVWASSAVQAAQPAAGISQQRIAIVGSLQSLQCSHCSH